MDATPTASAPTAASPTPARTKPRRVMAAPRCSDRSRRRPAGRSGRCPDASRRAGRRTRPRPPGTPRSADRIRSSPSSPGPPIITMPPVSNCGSGMSIPCSRMHCAKASIASRCSWGMSPGLPRPVGIRSWQASCASWSFERSSLPGPAPIENDISPFEPTCGSGMSMPCSRMHWAKARAASSGSTDASGSADDAGAGDWLPRLATPDGLAVPPVHAASAAIATRASAIGTNQFMAGDSKRGGGAWSRSTERP